MESLVKVAALLTVIAVFTVSPKVAAQKGSSADEVLTNEKVLTMVKASLPASIIINKIRTTKTSFNTSTEELIRLQQAHVPTEIINTMDLRLRHQAAAVRATSKS